MYALCHANVNLVLGGMNMYDTICLHFFQPSLI